MTKLKSLVIALIALLGPQASFAINVEDALGRQAKQSSWSDFTRSSDTLLMSLFYTGAATEAYVTINNEFIRAFAPFQVVDTSNFGVANGSYAFATAGTSSIG